MKLPEVTGGTSTTDSFLESFSRWLPQKTDLKQKVSFSGVDPRVGVEVVADSSTTQILK